MCRNLKQKKTKYTHAHVRAHNSTNNRNANVSKILSFSFANNKQHPLLDELSLKVYRSRLRRYVICHATLAQQLNEELIIASRNLRASYNVAVSQLQLLETSRDGEAAFERSHVIQVSVPLCVCDPPSKISYGVRENQPSEA